MEKEKSWRHEGGKFKRRASSLKSRKSGIQEPLIEEGGRGDVEQGNSSRHSRVVGSAKPANAGWGGEYLKSIVYGGLDAIVTSFALVASVSGGDLPAGSVLVLGFANLIADGISMGYGDYLSSTAEKDYSANQQLIGDWGAENDIHGEIMELVSAYREQGMEKDDADKIVDVLSKYKDIMVDQKLTLTQGLLPPDPEDSPLKNGLVTFASFLAFGSTPLLTYLILKPFTNNNDLKFLGACIVTILALALLGAAKARISGQNMLPSIAVVVFNGGIAAAAAYGISYLLNNIFQIQE
jgi:VIT1/CCC1 family predicted Fe2+/Mn2+ transporter